MATNIHPSAIVAKGAKIADGVTIGPFCTIGPNVKIGKGTKIVSHVSIEGSTTLGKNNEISPFACIGQEPQDMTYKGEDTALVIGNNNKIREYVTIHKGTAHGKGVTTIGNDNFLMAYVHIAHDCTLGNHIIMVNYAGLAGHVVMEDHVVASGMLGVHQHVRLGEYSMLGGICRIGADVPPYMMVAGAEKAKLYGLNTIGLKRNGFSDQAISELKSAYRIIFRKKLTFKEAIKMVHEELPDTQYIRHLVEFLQESKRGFCR